MSQPQVLATEYVALTDPPALHDQDQTRGDIAYINNVQNGIHIQLEPPAEKIPDHFRRRRQFVIVGPNGHRRVGNDDGRSI
ncbi:MAG TPA: hypothetical protein VKW08_04290 [Xanthobacteraceae bacterium]|nr:hypothetical protein [Xanthobacteraceae bacterium]